MAQRLRGRRLAERKRSEAECTDRGGNDGTDVSGRIGAEKERITADTGNGQTTLSASGTGLFYCYMVECSNGSFYTGWTTNPERRLKAHNSGHGASYTKMHSPVSLVYVEKMESRHEAMIRETEIKKYSHAEKAAMSESWKKSTVSEERDRKDQQGK